MNLGIAVIRAVVGVLFMGHGLQKLKGWFGGHGPDATGEAFDGMGLKPGKAHATAAGISETAGGALFATGLLTPLSGTMLTGTMTVAIERVHFRNGLWNQDSGIEYPLVLIGSAFAITATGPGAFSLDRALGIDRWGPKWALAQLAAGVAGGAAVVAAGRLGAKAEQADEPEPPRFTQRAPVDGEAAEIDADTLDTYAEAGQA